MATMWLIVGLSVLALDVRQRSRTTDPAEKLITVTHGPAPGWSGKENFQMCFGPFSPPKMPKPPPIPPLPPPPPPPPARDDPAVNAAAEAKRKRQLAARGIGSTILTSPLGVADEASTGQKTLLGG